MTKNKVSAEILTQDVHVICAYAFVFQTRKVPTESVER